MSIQTSSVSYSGSGYTIVTSFILEWTEEISVSDNTSVLSWTLKTNQSPTGSGYRRTFNSSGSYVTINGHQVGIQSQQVYNGLIVARGSETIRHNDDGTKSVSVAIRCNVGGDYCSANRSIDLTRIDRINQMEITPQTLSSGTATITITKYVRTYTTSIEYEIASQIISVASQSTETTFSIAFDDVKALIGNYTTELMLVTATTYDGSTAIGSVSKEIIIQTGVMPMSLYDDREGSVGVTIGERATEGGFWVKGVPADFTQATEVRGIYEEIKGTNIYGRKWANGYLEYWIDKYVPSGSYTAWQGHYYRDWSPSVTFPTPFVQIKGANANYDNATAYSTALRELNNNTAPTIRLMAFTNQSGLTGNMHIYIWGWWK